MKKIIVLGIFGMLTLLQSCASPSRTVAQENEFEEKKHHYPPLRRIDRY